MYTILMAPPYTGDKMSPVILSPVPATIIVCRRRLRRQYGREKTRSLVHMGVEVDGDGRPTRPATFCLGERFGEIALYLDHLPDKVYISLQNISTDLRVFAVCP